MLCRVSLVSCPHRSLLLRDEPASAPMRDTLWQADRENAATPPRLSATTAAAAAQLKAPRPVADLFATSGSDFALRYPLHLAAASGDAASLARLLEEGADGGQGDGEGRTALMYAVFYDQIACVRILLGRDANPNQQAQGAFGGSAGNRVRCEENIKRKRNTPPIGLIPLSENRCSRMRLKCSFSSIF